MVPSTTLLTWMTPEPLLNTSETTLAKAERRHLSKDEADTKARERAGLDDRMQLLEPNCRARSPDRRLGTWVGAQQETRCD